MMDPAKLLLLIFSFRSVVAPLTNAGTREREYGMEMSKVLKEKVLNNFIRLKELEIVYQRHALPTIEHNITDFVHRKASTLERILSEKENIVKRVAKEAERLRNRTYPELTVLKEKVSFHYENPPVNNTPPHIDPSVVPYHYSRCNCEQDLGGVIKPSQCFQYETIYEVNNHFGSEKVSFLNTTVHLPIDVYEEDQLVLRDIYLSDGIDDVIKQEVCSESEFSHMTKWIYYASETGVMRFFPDRIWTTNCAEISRLYDSRSAPWYVNRMTSPKDVILLIDSSGSVKGPTYTALVWSIREFLKTLTTNDFMNVVLFNKNIDFMNDCQGLFQATTRNKQIVLRLLESVEFRYETVYEPAFQKVFSMLSSATYSNSSRTARCNPSVVLFTDGDSTTPVEAMARWNAEKEFRVFSFAIGETFFSKEDTKNIACKNRGFYETIPFFEARQRVRQYLNKLSQPMAFHLERSPMWTLSYKDQLGLGVVVSVSVPVYHNDQTSSNNQSSDDAFRVIGVVGTDLALEDLKNVIYDDDMTRDYYPFVIDNNGFAIIHPNLKETGADDVLTQDFVEIEDVVEDEFVAEVRDEIIEGVVSEKRVSRKMFFENKYIQLSDYKYAYAPVKGTVFRVGVGVHASKAKYVDSTTALQRSYPQMSMNTLTNPNDPGSISDTFLYSSPCITSTTGGYNPCNVNKTTSYSCQDCYVDGLPLQEFSDADCDKTTNLYSNLLLHAFITDEFSMDTWEASNSVVKDGEGALALFTAIDAPSFVRITYLNFTKQMGESPSKSDELIKKDIKEQLADPRNSTYFRRAAHKPQWTIYSYFRGSADTVVDPIGTTESTQSTQSMETTASTQTTVSYVDSEPGYILATKAVQVVEDNNELVSVVTGVVIDSDAFTRNLVGLDWKCNDTSNCNKDQWDLLCGDESMECLVVDDGGYLISSNQDRHRKTLGQFIGLMEGELTRRLVWMDVYRVYNTTDYQAYCERIDQEKSAGVRVRMPHAPSIADILSFGWWLSSYAWIFLYTVFQNFLVGFSSVLNIGYSRILLTEGASTSHKMEICVLKYPVLAFGANGHNSVYGEFQCSAACRRKFNAVRIVETNLMIIIIELDETSSCYDACHATSPYTMTATDATLETMCNNSTAQYRQTPGHCYDARDLDEAFDSACSTAFTLSPSYHVTFFLVLFVNFIICHGVS